MKRDLTPWLLLPSIVLTLGSVTLLAPHQAALAGPPTPAQAVPQAPADDDGDELLEHWGDPQFSKEEQTQMAGMAAGFLLLGTVTAVRRSRRKSRFKTVSLPSEMEFLKLAPRNKADVPTEIQTDTRKAA